ncbi:MAG TPA: hypothetical protein VIX59_01235 [Candidatus Binataceae bacterium]
MAVHTKRFPSEEEYETWLQIAGSRIRVLTVRSVEAGPTRSGLRGSQHQVIITYRATDKDLSPRRARMLVLVEAIVIVAALVVVGAYLMHQTIAPPEAPMKLESH